MTADFTQNGYGYCMQFRFVGDDCVTEVRLHGEVIDPAKYPLEEASPNGGNDEAEDAPKEDNAPPPDTDAPE